MKNEHPVEIRLSNPEVVSVETPAGSWFLSATGAGSLAKRVRDRSLWGLSPVEVVERLAPEMEEGTVLFVPGEGFSDPRVLAFKSVICSRDLYWARTGTGRFVVGDRFADLLPLLSGEARVLSDRRAAHYLMGCNIRGDWTLLEAVNRVGHGELLLFSPNREEPEKKRVQRFSWNSVIEDEEAAAETLEGALEKTCGHLRQLESRALMFSGGTDSTLLWSFLGPQTTALAGFVDTEPAERDAARNTAARHGIPLRLMELREEDFLEEFRGALRDAGMPFIISNFQMLYYRMGFRQGFSHLVSGELADTLWGIAHTARIFREPEKGPYARAIATSPLLPGGYGIRIHLLLPDDMGVLSHVFGWGTLLGFLQDNLSYVRACLDPAVPLDRDFRKGHADLGTLAFILNGMWRANYRQAGYVHGVGMSFPFESLSVARAALSVALPGRILSKEGVLKPAVHGLLAQRLPGAVPPGKSGSGVPRTRYCQEGPLKGFFRERPVPSFWPAEWAGALENPSWETSSVVLKCASLALWEEEVLRKAGSPENSAAGAARPS